MAEEDNPSFHYTYSAKQQEEVKRIRQKYLPPTEDKMAQLRRLDKSAERKGTKRHWGGLVEHPAFWRRDVLYNPLDSLFCGGRRHRRAGAWWYSAGLSPLCKNHPPAAPKNSARNFGFNR